MRFKSIKQDIHIYVAYSRPNGWTDWANFFCGHSWLKKIEILFSKKILFQIFFSKFFFFRAMPGLSACIKNKVDKL